METRDVRPPATDIWYATTHEERVEDAVSSLQEQLSGHYLSLLLVFFSPRFDAENLAQALSNVFSPTVVVGCSTAGEFSPQGMIEGSIVAIGFSTETFAFVPKLVEDLRELRSQDVGSMVQDAFYTLDRRVGGLNRSDTFGLMFADGLSQREEQLAAAFNVSLRGAPLVGASAADQMTFTGTKIMFKGKVYDNAAILLIARCQLPFCAFSCDHYEPTEVRMVVTKADAERRIVYEFNAAPAAVEYAAAIGAPLDELGPTEFAQHPLAVRVGGKFYARAIKEVCEGDGLAFMSAVDTGVVFSLARADDIIENIRSTFDDIRVQVGRPQLVLGFECLFRRLEIEGNQLKQRVEAIYAENQVVGFHCYGEQFRAMHLNQTLTGMAIGAR